MTDAVWTQLILASVTVITSIIAAVAASFARRDTKDIKEKAVVIAETAVAIEGKAVAIQVKAEQIEVNAENQIAKLREISTRLDGRLSELLETMRSENLALGKAQGIAQEQERIAALLTSDATAQALVVEADRAEASKVVQADRDEARAVVQADREEANKPTP